MTVVRLHSTHFFKELFLTVERYAQDMSQGSCWFTTFSYRNNSPNLKISRLHVVFFPKIF